jgi:hypothetical protein
MCDRMTTAASPSSSSDKTHDGPSPDIRNDATPTDNAETRWGAPRVGLAAKRRPPANNAFRRPGSAPATMRQSSDVPALGYMDSIRVVRSYTGSPRYSRSRLTSSTSRLSGDSVKSEKQTLASSADHLEKCQSDSAPKTMMTTGERSPQILTSSASSPSVPSASVAVRPRQYNSMIRLPSYTPSVGKGSSTSSSAHSQASTPGRQALPAEKVRQPLLHSITGFRCVSYLSGLLISRASIISMFMYIAAYFMKP